MVWIYESKAEGFPHADGFGFKPFQESSCSGLDGGWPRLSWQILAALLLNHWYSDVHRLWLQQTQSLRDQGRAKEKKRIWPACVTFPVSIEKEAFSRHSNPEWLKSRKFIQKGWAKSREQVFRTVRTKLSHYINLWHNVKLWFKRTIDGIALQVANGCRV